MRLSADENVRLTAFEKAGMERYVAYEHKCSIEGLDSKVAETGARYVLGAL